MKKHLANIISSSRIIGACALLCMTSFTPLFLVIYVICGMTDLIDGPIARKYNCTSALGAALDTIGDVLTYLSIVKVLVMQHLIPSWLLIWLFTLIALFFGVAFYALKKFGKFFLPHTYIGKGLGAMVFVLPVMMQVMDGRIWMALICSVITLHYFESFYVQIKSIEPYDFVPSAFHVKKENEKALSKSTQTE